MIIENNKKKSAWRRVATSLFIFLFTGSFLFGQSAAAAVTGDYNKSVNGTLSASEWNNLIKDFISVNGGEIDGNLNIVGTLQATSLAGTYTGTLNSANVSSGQFGSNTGGGNYTFSGNVGIGTTNPRSKLHIYDSGVSKDTYDDYFTGGLIVQSGTGARSITNGAQLEFAIPANTDGTNAWGQGRIITVAGNTDSGNAAGKMILGTRRYFNKMGISSQWYYGDDITIDGNGNVGIGTTAPAQKLDVAGNANFSGTVTAGSFSGPMSGTLSSGNVSAGTFGSNTGGGNYAFTGNVGIGTTNPGQKLELLGNFTSSGTFPVNNVIRFSAANGGGGIWGTGEIGSYIASNNGGVGNYPGGLIFRTKVPGNPDNTFADRMVIDSNGNVGIGTTNPDSLLTVSGGNITQIGGSSYNSFAKELRIDVGGGTNNGLYLNGDMRFGPDYSGPRTGLFKYNPSIDGLIIDTWGSGKSVRIGGSSVILGVGEGGQQSNVGIGTTDPSSAKLVIAPSGNGYSIDAGGGRIGNITSVNDTDAASVAYVKAVVGGGSGSTVGYWTANGTNIYNSNGGGIAIGTTDPGAYKLNVNGNTNINGILTATSISGPMSGTLNSANVSSGIFGSNTGGGDYAFTGNVGIGTTNPTALLQITGLNTQGLPSTSGSASNESEFRIRSGSGTPILDFGVDNATTNSSWIQARRASDYSINYNLLLNPNGGNVGIGTTAPAQKLDVAGDANFSGTVTAGSFSGPMSGTLSSGNVSAGQFGSNTGGGNYIFGATVPGNLGIGTTIPQAKLTVNGFPGARDAMSTTFQTYAGVVGSTAGDELALGSIGGASGNMSALGVRLERETSGSDWTTSGIQLSYDVDNSPRAGAYIELSHNGNVGIGTTNPGAKLDVLSGNTQGDNAGSINIRSTSGSNVLKFGIDGTNNFAELRAYTPGVGDNSKLLLQPYGGNVGIGTTNPGAKLVVDSGAQNALVYESVLTGRTEDLTGIYGPVLGFQTEAAAGYGPKAGIAFVRSGGYGTGDLHFLLSSSADYAAPTLADSKFTILRTGNVGIGTTAPSQKLDVTGNANFSGTVTAGSFSGPYSGTISSGNVSSGTFGSNTGGGSYYFTGNVGIGTTNPGTKFELAGGHTDTTFRMNAQTGQASPNDNSYLSFWASEPGWTYTGAGIGNNINGNAAYGRINTARGASYIRLLDNAISFSTINSSGSDINNMYMSSGLVGIGTTDPGAYKLNVNGNTNITGNLNVTGTITGGSAMTATLSSGNVSSGEFGSNTGGGNYIFGATVPGNVGIGTTNPGALLAVNGASIFGSGQISRSQTATFSLNNSDTFVANSDITDSNRSMNIVNESLAANTYAPLSFRTQANGNTGMLDMKLVGNNDFTSKLYFTFKDTTPSNGFYDRMVIQSNGNVGIGTTAPSEAKLVINAGSGTALKAYGNGIFTGTLQTQTGSDFAEEFTTSKDLEQGTVVVMDDNGHKSVRPCNKGYDKTVVGIVSNNPSIIAGRVTSEHKAIIAMMGVVKVKVVDINGTIAKGDLLTTSGVYGYAMKAAKSKPGTIIGKALEDLNTASGQINVLVNLQ